MISQTDITLLKNELVPAISDRIKQDLTVELVPALSDQVKKDLEAKLDWIMTTLDKQSGNLQTIQQELVIISGKIELHSDQLSHLSERVKRLEKKVGLSDLRD